VHTNSFVVLLKGSVDIENSFVYVVSWQEEDDHLIEDETDGKVQNTGICE